MTLLDQIAAERVTSRRDFLRLASATAVGAKLLSFQTLRAQQRAHLPKVVVVTFGGGARDQETFAPEGQENIPHLLNELIPQATFFTQVVNRGILGHYVATASLATGVYEQFNNFTKSSPSNPTIFECFRKDLQRPAEDAWVIAPGNGFNHIGQSDASRFAKGFGAEVVMPKQMLASAASAHSVAPGAFGTLLQDNYEQPFLTPPSAKLDLALDRAQRLLRVSMENFLAHSGTMKSADELSVYVMERVMQQFAPSLLWITLHDMDVAHSGAYSLYTDAIRRTDRLCSRIWNSIQSDPEYKNRTTLVVLPDFGRDSDFDGAGNGFQHHRTGDALSRTTWMMVLGPHVRQNETVDRQIQSIDLMPTIGTWMGLNTPFSTGRPVTEVL